MGKESESIQKRQGKRAESPDKLTKSNKSADKRSRSPDKIKTSNGNSEKKATNSSAKTKQCCQHQEVKVTTSKGSTKTSLNSDKKTGSADTKTKASQESRPSTKSSGRHGQINGEKKARGADGAGDRRKAEDSKQSNRSRSMEHGKDLTGSKKKKRPKSADTVLDLTKFEKRTITVYVRREDADSNRAPVIDFRTRDGKVVTERVHTKEQKKGVKSESNRNSESQRRNKRSASTGDKARVLNRPKMRSPYQDDIDWPADSPVAKTYDIGNTSAKLVILNNKYNNTKLRGHDNHQRPHSADPDRHTSGAPAKNTERHNPCLDSRSPGFEPKPKLHNMWVNQSQRPPWTPQENANVNPRRHRSCRVSSDPAYQSLENFKPKKPTGVQRKDPRPSISMKDNSVLVHPGVPHSNRSYLNYISKTYDMSNMKQLKQLQYRDLVMRQQYLGFHTDEQYRKYMMYIEGARKRQFGTKDALFRSGNRSPRRSQSSLGGSSSSPTRVSRSEESMPSSSRSSTTGSTVPAPPTRPKSSTPRTRASRVREPVSHQDNREPAKRNGKRTSRQEANTGKSRKSITRENLEKRAKEKKESVTPRDKTESPREGATPRNNTVSPREGASPREGTESPRAGATPRDKTESPRAGATPRDNTESPRAGATPSDTTESPREGATPRDITVSPRAGATPRENTESPRAGATPRENTESPRAGATPRDNTESPRAGATPSDTTESPREGATPRDITVSPRAGATPRENTESPRAGATPRENTESPRAGATPREGTESPRETRTDTPAEAQGRDSPQAGDDGPAEDGTGTEEKTTRYSSILRNSIGSLSSSSSFPSSSRSSSRLSAREDDTPRQDRKPSISSFSTGSLKLEPIQARHRDKLDLSDRFNNNFDNDSVNSDQQDGAKTSRKGNSLEVKDADHEAGKVETDQKQQEGHNESDGKLQRLNSMSSASSDSDVSHTAKGNVDRPPSVSSSTFSESEPSSNDVITKADVHRKEHSSSDGEHTTSKDHSEYPEIHIQRTNSHHASEEHTSEATNDLLTVEGDQLDTVSVNSEILRTPATYDRKYQSEDESFLSAANDEKQEAVSINSDILRNPASYDRKHASPRGDTNGQHLLVVDGDKQDAVSVNSEILRTPATYDARYETDDGGNESQLAASFSKSSKDVTDDSQKADMDDDVTLDGSEQDKQKELPKDGNLVFYFKKDEADESSKDTTQGENPRIQVDDSDTQGVGKAPQDGAGGETQILTCEETSKDHLTPEKNDEYYIPHNLSTIQEEMENSKLMNQSSSASTRGGDVNKDESQLAGDHNSHTESTFDVSKHDNTLNQMVSDVIQGAHQGLTGPHGGHVTKQGQIPTGGSKLVEGTGRQNEDIKDEGQDQIGLVAESRQKQKDETHDGDVTVTDRNLSTSQNKEIPDGDSSFDVSKHDQTMDQFVNGEIQTASSHVGNETTQSRTSLNEEESTFDVSKHNATLGAYVDDVKDKAGADLQPEQTDSTFDVSKHNATLDVFVVHVLENAEGQIEPVNKSNQSAGESELTGHRAESPAESQSNVSSHNVALDGDASNTTFLEEQQGESDLHLTGTAHEAAELKQEEQSESPQNKEFNKSASESTFDISKHNATLDVYVGSVIDDARQQMLPDVSPSENRNPDPEQTLVQHSASEYEQDDHSQIPSNKSRHETKEESRNESTFDVSKHNATLDGYVVGVIESAKTHVLPSDKPSDKSVQSEAKAASVSSDFPTQRNTRDSPEESKLEITGHKEMEQSMMKSNSYASEHDATQDGEVGDVKEEEPVNDRQDNMQLQTSETQDVTSTHDKVHTEVQDDTELFETLNTSEAFPYTTQGEAFEDFHPKSNTPNSEAIRSSTPATMTHYHLPDADISEVHSETVSHYDKISLLSQLTLRNVHSQAEPDRQGSAHTDQSKQSKESSEHTIGVTAVSTSSSGNLNVGEADGEDDEKDSHHASKSDSNHHNQSDTLGDDRSKQGHRSESMSHQESLSQGDRISHHQMSGLDDKIEVTEMSVRGDVVSQHEVSSDAGQRSQNKSTLSQEETLTHHEGSVKGDTISQPDMSNQEDTINQHEAPSQGERVSQNESVSKIDSINQHETFSERNNVSQHDTISTGDGVSEHEASSQRNDESQHKSLSEGEAVSHNVTNSQTDRFSQHDTLSQIDRVGANESLSETYRASQHETLSQEDRVSQHDTSDNNHVNLQKRRDSASEISHIESHNETSHSSDRDEHIQSQLQEKSENEEKSDSVDKENSDSLVLNETTNLSENQVHNKSDVEGFQDEASAADVVASDHSDTEKDDDRKGDHTAKEEGTQNQSETRAVSQVEDTVNKSTKISMVHDLNETVTETKEVSQMDGNSENPDSVDVDDQIVDVTRESEGENESTVADSVSHSGEVQNVSGTVDVREGGHVSDKEDTQNESKAEGVSQVDAVSENKEIQSLHEEVGSLQESHSTNEMHEDSAQTYRESEPKAVSEIEDNAQNDSTFRDESESDNVGGILGHSITESCDLSGEVVNNTGKSVETSLNETEQNDGKQVEIQTTFDETLQQPESTKDKDEDYTEKENGDMNTGNSVQEQDSNQSDISPDISPDETLQQPDSIESRSQGEEVSQRELSLDATLQQQDSIQATEEVYTTEESRAMNTGDSVQEQEISQGELRSGSGGIMAEKGEPNTDDDMEDVVQQDVTDVTRHSEKSEENEQSSRQEVDNMESDDEEIQPKQNVDPDTQDKQSDDLSTKSESDEYEGSRKGVHKEGVDRPRTRLGRPDGPALASSEESSASGDESEAGEVGLSASFYREGVDRPKSRAGRSTRQDRDGGDSSGEEDTDQEEKINTDPGSPGTPTPAEEASSQQSRDVVDNTEKDQQLLDQSGNTQEITQTADGELEVQAADITGHSEVHSPREQGEIVGHETGKADGDFEGDIRSRSTVESSDEEETTEDEEKSIDGNRSDGSTEKQKELEESTETRDDGSSVKENMDGSITNRGGENKAEKGRVSERTGDEEEQSKQNDSETEADLENMPERRHFDLL